MTSSPGLRTAAVLPVGGRSPLLDGCLMALRRQRALVDELIVVDDSPEGNVRAVEGARVLCSRGRGPYAARNLGWRATEAELVLFLDVRSRPLPHWSQRLTERFGDGSVAIVGSEVRVVGGTSLAARACQRQQPFDLRAYLAQPFFLPYLPTCNLAVRRDDLVAVGGFSAVRSGGDADLCWRILSRHGRRLQPVHEVLMEWIPRERLRDYLEQNYRYGKSNHELRRTWKAAGAPEVEPMARAVLARGIVKLGIRAGVSAARRRQEDLVDHVVAGGELAYQLGYRVATDTERPPGDGGDARAAVPA